MKPIAIFRFSPSCGPGYFAAFLDARSIPWMLFALDEGATVPADLNRYSGFVFMGGPMSVNDDLPWIPPVLQLIQQAFAHDMPCLGHCLGGQLMSKALGGAVTKSAVKEIGWQPVRVVTSPAAQAWFGGIAGPPSNGIRKHSLFRAVLSAFSPAMPVTTRRM